MSKQKLFTSFVEKYYSMKKKDGTINETSPEIKEMKKEIIKNIFSYYKLTRNTDQAAFFYQTDQGIYGWKKGGWDVYTVYDKVKGDISADYLLTGNKDVMETKNTSNQSDEIEKLNNEISELQSQLDFYKNMYENSKKTIEILQKFIDSK